MWARRAPLRRGRRVGEHAQARPRPTGDDHGVVAVRLTGLSLRISGEKRMAPEPLEALSLQPTLDRSAGRGGGATALEGERCVVLVGFAALSTDAVAARLPGVRCVVLKAAGEEPADLFVELATRLFALLQAKLCRRRPAGGALVRLLVESETMPTVARGLASLLKTASLEWLNLRTQWT